MFRKFRELKENIVFKIIYNILYWALFILTLMILIVILIQRFSDNTFALGGFRIFNVVTGSMSPKYEVGDILLSKTKEISEVSVGDDVVYNGTKGDFAGRIVTHQVIEVKQENGEYIFKTKGIANEQEDPEITGDQIMGVVIYKIRTISLVSHMINNLYSFYFVIFIPLVVLIFIEIRKVVSRSKEE